MSRTARQSADQLAQACLSSRRDEGQALDASGPRGSIRFHVQRCPGGLYVERDEHPMAGTRTIQSLTFTERERLDRWLEQDPVRFDHPLLHERLRRAADALWDPAGDSPP